MPRDIPLPTLQREFLLKALKEGQRMDGRNLLDMRDVQISFGKLQRLSAARKGKQRDTSEIGGLEELGEVEVKMGKTRVLASVSASIVKPRQDRPYEGVLVISSEMGPMAGPSYDTGGRQSEAEVIVSRLLEKAIRRSEALDREALCIVAGEKVWQIRLTVHFLSDDGNLLDAACLAGMTAVRHYRKPEVEVLGEEVIIHDPLERAPLPLAIHHTPLCVTFAYFDDNVIAIDPTLEETKVATGTMTVTLNAQRELCVLSKAGGSPLTVEEIMRVVRIASDRVRELVAKVESELKADWDIRGKLLEVR